MTNFLTCYSDSLNKYKMSSIQKECRGYLLKYNIHFFFLEL